MKLNAYELNKKAKTILGVIIFVLVIGYLGVIIWEENETAKYINTVASGQKVTLSTATYIISFLKNLLTVAFSITISSFLTSIFLEKRNRNQIFTESFNDIVDSSNIVLNIENNKRVSSKLETKLPNKTIPTDMAEAVSKKIFLSEEKYYYENCKVEIVCKIIDGIVEKEIKKEMYLRSYEKEYTFDNTNPLVLVKQTTLPGISKQLECSEVHITSNNKDMQLSTKEYEIISDEILDPINKKQNSTSQKTLKLKKTIKINNIKSTKITIKYITRTPIDDLDYIFRVPCSCKTLDFSFRINTDGYKASGYAFGFLDDASTSISSNEENVVQYKFEDWIFKRDGISVFIKNVNN